MAEIRINATGGVKLYDADDSHYAQIVAGTITSNVDAITLGHDTVTIADNLSLGSDSAVLKFGADGDTTLTHTDGTGLTLNSANKLLFRDTGLYVYSSTDGQLDIVADTEVQIAATTIDINGAVALNGAITGATDITLSGELDAATLDISGNADIDGTLETDALSIASTTVSATAAELNYSDLATLGTTAASKVFTADANNLTKITGGVYLEEDTLSFDATQDWDVRASPVAKVTLTANVTFDLPSNPTTGQYISIVCIQDGTGSRTIAWNAAFEFTGDSAPTATTTASKGDMFTFRYNGSKWLEVGRNLNLTLS